MKTRTFTVKIAQGRGRGRVTLWLGNGKQAEQELRTLDPDMLRKHKEGYLMIQIPIRDLAYVRDSAAVSVWM